MPLPLIPIIVAVVRLAAPVVINTVVKQVIKQAPKVAKEVAKQAPKAAKEAVKAAPKKAASGPKKGNTPLNKYKDKAKKEKKKKGPCDHLKKGQGKGDYRGGAHSETSKPRNDGKDSHHMPADDASPLPKKEGPAIQMDPKDHRLTKSNGSQPRSAGYRAGIEALLKDGKWRDAMAKEIKDIRRIQKLGKTPKKYNEAMREMLSYFKCLEQHELLPKA